MRAAWRHPSPVRASHAARAAEPGRTGPIRTPCVRPAPTHRVHDEHGADRADRRADPVRDHVARIHGAIRHQESLPELGDDADRRAEHSGRDDAEHGRPPIDDERPEHPERQEERRVGGELDERVARPCRDAESCRGGRGPGRSGTGRRVRRRAPARTARPRAPRRRARRSRRAIAAQGDSSSRMRQRPRRLHCTPSAPGNRMESSVQASRTGFRARFPAHVGVGRRRLTVG